MWPRRARLAVAVIGLACLAAVSLTMGRRHTAPPREPASRLDPRAVFESTTGRLQQLRGVDKDFDIRYDRQTTYDDGSSALQGVTITVTRRGGRDFVVTAGTASATERSRDLELAGQVTLKASDGFHLEADDATFNQDTGLVAADGTVTFGRGRMRGAGAAFTYDQRENVLTIGSGAHIDTTDEEGAPAVGFTAGTAVLDRVQDLLTLEGDVHVRRGDEVMQADVVRARLSPDESVVTFVALAGRATVDGGRTSLGNMTADAIDLAYSPDGETLERVALRSRARVALVDSDGSPGRQLSGDSLDLQLAPDGSVIGTSGRGHVAMVMPAATDLPARRIQSNALDATGAEGRGLTDARFSGDVAYSEAAAGSTAARSARSAALGLALTETGVGQARFSGAVTFEEGDLHARADQATYVPDSGALDLLGARDQVPCVADGHITIEGGAVHVRLGTREIAASGNVTTTLSSGAATARPTAGPCGVPVTAASGARTSAVSNRQQGRLPGLLDGDSPAHVSAAALTYAGAGGAITYQGNAALVQGDTAMRAETLIIDQDNGNLTATGNARSTIVLDTGTLVGQASEIAYDDRSRTIAYGGRPAPGVALPLAHLAGPGPRDDLQAARIAVVLGEGHVLERLEAHERVRTITGTRAATGDQLTYEADSGRYDMTGTAAAPVRVVDGCRTLSGKTLTFFKSTDRIIVDGNNEIFTRTASGSGSCDGAAVSPRAR